MHPRATGRAYSSVCSARRLIVWRPLADGLAVHQEDLVRAYLAGVGMGAPFSISLTHIENSFVDQSGHGRALPRRRTCVDQHAKACPDGLPIILFATAWLLHCRHARAEVVARRGGAEAHLRFVQMLVNNGIANGHRFLTQKSIGAVASNQIGFLPIAGYPPMGLPPEVCGSATLCSFCPIPPPPGSPFPRRVRLGRHRHTAHVGAARPAHRHPRLGAVDRPGRRAIATHRGKCGDARD